VKRVCVVQRDTRIGSTQWCFQQMAGRWPQLGEASIPVEEQREGSLEPAISTAEDPPLEGVAVFEPPPVVEAPEEESLGECAPSADEVAPTSGT